MIPIMLFLGFCFFGLGDCPTDTPTLSDSYYFGMQLQDKPTLSDSYELALTINGTDKPEISDRYEIFKDQLSITTTPTITDYATVIKN